MNKLLALIASIVTLLSTFRSKVNELAAENAELKQRLAADESELANAQNESSARLTELNVLHKQADDLVAELEAANPVADPTSETPAPVAPPAEALPAEEPPAEAPPAEAPPQA